MATGFSAVTASSVASSAGVGAANGVLRATTSSIAFAAGIGVASGLGNAVWPMVAFAAGASDAQASALTWSSAVAYSAGQGNAYAISYAFFLDAEVVCVQDEPRTALVPDDDFEEDLVLEIAEENREAFIFAENRVSVVPWERRDQDADARSQSADTLNRKRTC